MITTAFWGDGTETVSNDTLEEIKKNGGFLISRQLLDVEEACISWKKYYDMTENQYQLLREIYERKIEQPNQMLLMSLEEISMIGTDDEERLEESKTSFSEIRILWQE